jgi:hypothetical protein
MMRSGTGNISATTRAENSYEGDYEDNEISEISQTEFDHDEVSTSFEISLRL